LDSIPKRSRREDYEKMPSTKYSILKNLTKNELREICERYGIKGYSNLKQKELAKFVSKNLKIPIEEIEALARRFSEDKLLCKINDAKDYFLTKQVQIDHFSDELIKARVKGYDVIIKNFGAGSGFSYTCDERCYDYKYQVKSGRSLFCKHYPAVIMELLLQGKISSGVNIPCFSDRLSGALLEIVEERKKIDGISIPTERNIEQVLENLNSDFMRIAMQDSLLAREKYRSTPEKVFEDMVDDAFQLLEYNTIPRKTSHGWDLIVVAAHAVSPYIAIVECKTAANGVYDHLVRNPGYLIRLKDYCIDMVKNKLVGFSRDFVKYMVLVAPGFTEEIEPLSLDFKEKTRGMVLSFLPVPTLLYLVQRYRENPILMHQFCEHLFRKGGIIINEDVDEIFRKNDEYIKELARSARRRLRSKMDDYSRRRADADFIKFDGIMFTSLIKEVLLALDPDLVEGGRQTRDIDVINVKHDYYKIWEIILHELSDEFSDILKEVSRQQVKRPELVERIITDLSI
jgi:hypothetical protein